ncbi:phage tail length tape measure family protein [Microbulbifer sp. 2304DJ12-6]|uniref:phage tail length tape measure family protein n=1 Tax=Microbulbifer sp. 2304DJ12-6 TaxID=3233340 RepID=UPI0039AEEFC9
MSDRYHFAIQGDDRTAPMFRRLKRNMRNNAKEAGVLQRSMRGAAQGVASIDGPLGGVSGRVGALNGLLTSGAASWGLFGAGVAGVTAVLYKSIRAGEEMERQQLKIEALLKATGGASGRTAQQLDEQARSVARATLASVSGIREAQGILITFKGVQGPVFDNAIRLSQDMAAVMGGDAKSAALQLGKALEEPSTGLTALRRAGVSFTEAEKEQIKTLQQSGRVAEAQRMILLKLEQQVGGAGAGEAGGLTGATDSLGQSWQEFLEGLSETTDSTSIATAGIQKLTEVVDTFRRGLAPTEEELQRAQFAELHKQYTWHQQMLAKAEREGVRIQIEIHRNKSEQLRSQLVALQGHQIAAQKKLQDKQRAAEAAAATAREQAERDRIARERVMAEEAGGAQLIQLDQFLADQRGKIQLDHEQRLQQIAALHIAEQELTRRGFDSIEALREEYAARETARYQMALAAEQARAANDEGHGNGVGADGLTNREREQIVAKLETLQLSWLTEMEQLQVQQDEEMALLDQAYISKQEILAEHLAATQATEEESRQASLALEGEYQRNLTLLEKKHAKDRENLDKASSKSELQMFSTGAKQIFSAASAHSKKMAKLSKAAAIFETGISLVKNIARASEIGYPQNIPMIAGAVAQGVKIAGMLSGLKAPSDVSAGSASGAPTAAPQPQNNSLDGINQFASNDAQQPQSLYQLIIQGDVIGDSSERFIEDIQTKMENGDLLLFSNNSRQAQELKG